MITLSEENYLKAILSINLETKNIVSTNEIAGVLNTSPASVSEMIKKLEEKNLVDYEKYKGVSLSKSGEKLALEILRKHRLWETFLVNKLEFSWSEVHDVAEQLEHVKSKKLTNKLDHFLNYPKFDPHGEPIPSKNGIISPTKRVLLSEVPIKTNGIIMGVSTDESEFLDYLTQLNFKIGSKIKILDIILFDKSMKIQIGDKIEQISEEVTNNIHIKVIE